MTCGFHLDPNAIYDDAALVLGLDLAHATLAKARRSGQLRSTRKGRRVLYRGQWVIDWLEMNAESPSIPVAPRCTRTDGGDLR